LAACFQPKLLDFLFRGPGKKLHAPAAASILTPSVQKHKGRGITAAAFEYLAIPGSAGEVD